MVCENIFTATPCHALVDIFFTFIVSDKYWHFLLRITSKFMEQTQQHLFCLPYKLEVIRNIKKVPVFVTDNKSKKYNKREQMLLEKWFIFLTWLA